jgi:hypothetical protein
MNKMKEEMLYEEFRNKLAAAIKQAGENGTIHPNRGKEVMDYELEKLNIEYPDNSELYQRCSELVDITDNLARVISTTGISLDGLKTIVRKQFGIE